MSIKVSFSIQDLLGLDKSKRLESARNDDSPPPSDPEPAANRHDQFASAPGELEVSGDEKPRRTRKRCRKQVTDSMGYSPEDSHSESEGTCSCMVAS